VKTIHLFILIIVLVPSVSAYSITDFIFDTKEFFMGYFGLTGSVVLELTERASDLGAGSLKEISPEEINDGPDEKCKDSDLLDYYKQGICKTEDSKEQDYCSDDRTMVMEFYCNKGSRCVASWYVCDGKCVDGACVESESKRYL